MSGELIHLHGGVDGDIASLVRAAGLVVEHAGVRTAVIGGLAVACRLATAHRATGDVDIVADEPEVLAQDSTAARNLVAAGVAERVEGGQTVRVDVGGTKVEIIDTAALHGADAADVEPDRARLFVLAHRWALETATPIRIGVTGTDIEVEVPVATPAALVAMKLHAIEDRNDDTKRASDAWDLFRLITTHGNAHAFVAAYRSAPDGLVDLARASIERVFGTDVTRTRRWIQVYGQPDWAAHAHDDALIDIAALFTRALRPTT